MHEKTISIMLPTRGRIEGLTTIVGQLDENCADPSRVELLLKLDMDDEEVVKFVIKNLRPRFQVNAIVSDRRRGFDDLNCYMDELYQISRGDLLVFMTDDQYCETPNWDAIIAPYASNPLQALNPQHRDVGGYLSPILHRHLADLAGHTGKMPADVFWEFVHDRVLGGIFLQLDGHAAPLVVFRHERRFLPSWYVDGMKSREGNPITEEFMREVERVAALIRNEKAQTI